MCAPISEPFSSRQTETSRCSLRGELLQADRRGEARRAAADDDDVVLHRFARHDDPLALPRPSVPNCPGARTHRRVGDSPIV